MPQDALECNELFILGAGSSVPAQLPTAVELTARVRDRLTDFFKEEFDKLTLKATDEQINSINFESIFWELEKDIDTASGDNKSSLVKLRSVLVEQIRIILWQKSYSERLAYFEKFCKYVAKKISPVITLNWDNTVELAFENFCPETKLDLGLLKEKHRPVYRAVFSSENINTVKLVKLHGSLNLSNEARTFEYLEEENKGPIYFLDGNGPPSPSRNIVLGSNKLQKIEKDHFLRTCLNEYKQLLSGVEKITFIGYSFHDEHINNALANWKNDKNGKALITVVNGEGKLNDKAKQLLNGLDVVTFQGTISYFESLQIDT
ncbi:MAG: SIR2 family protein [Chlamydiales bacterium]|nr:SIR2 family protein [Chlamydiales bacterium]